MISSSKKEKMFVIMDHLKKQHELASNRQKKRWLSFVCNEFTMPQLFDMGWKVNSHTFCNAKKHFNEIGAGFEFTRLIN